MGGFGELDSRGSEVGAVRKRGSVGEAVRSPALEKPGILLEQFPTPIQLFAT